jgi:hypothetical protein
MVVDLLVDLEYSSFSMVDTAIAISVDKSTAHSTMRYLNTNDIQQNITVYRTELKYSLHKVRV